MWNLNKYVTHRMHCLQVEANNKLWRKQIILKMKNIVKLNVANRKKSRLNTYVL